MAQSENIKQREDVEWGNYWWSDASNNRCNNKRYLLIGDSTSRSYRSELEKVLRAKVDFFGTSARISDIMFWKQLECFLSFDEYQYDGIQIQLGYHGICLEQDDKANALEIWEGAYETLVQKLKKRTTNIVLASATHTVIFPNRRQMSIFEYMIYKWKLKMYGAKAEIKDFEKNAIIQLRNEKVKEIALNNNLKFLDLYNLMIDSNFRHIDGVHFEDSHKAYIVELVANELRTL